VLKLENLSVKIENKRLLTTISCTIQPGEIVVLLGNSGAGKTTLLRTIAGLVQPESGSMSLYERSFAEVPKNKVGMVTQAFGLFPQLTVLEQCTHPQIIVQNKTRQESTHVALKTLKSLGIDSLASTYPAQLSGGQQQRVALARLFCMDTQLLLLDEPTSALDPANTLIVAATLKQLASQGKIIILSTQDMDFAQQMIGRGLVLRDGELVEEIVSTTGTKSIKDRLLAI